MMQKANKRKGIVFAECNIVSTFEITKDGCVTTTEKKTPSRYDKVLFVSRDQLEEIWDAGWSAGYGYAKGTNDDRAKYGFIDEVLLKLDGKNNESTIHV